jgi:hypothetical protein
LKTVLLDLLADWRKCICPLEGHKPTCLARRACAEDLERELRKEPEPMVADRLTLGNAILNAAPMLPDGRGFSIAEAILDDYDVTVKRSTIEREIAEINKR